MSASASVSAIFKNTMSVLASLYSFVYTNSPITGYITIQNSSLEADVGLYQYNIEIEFLFLFWLFLEKFISFPYLIQNKIIIFLINQMSDTGDPSNWYIKRLGVKFFKFAQMFFIKSSQNFSISFILSIGVRK